MKRAVDATVPTSPAQSAVAREYGEKTMNAVTEMVRLADVGGRFVKRGHAWFSSDPHNAPGLACEGLINRLARMSLG